MKTGTKDSPLKAERLTITVPSGIARELRLYAATNGMSLSELFRFAIEKTYNLEMPGRTQTRWHRKRSEIQAHLIASRMGAKRKTLRL